MNSSDWTVTKVFDDPYAFNNEHGSFLVYRLFISDGHNEDQMVEWTRKSDAFAPQPQSVVHGTVTRDGTYKSGRPKLKFKLGKVGDAPSGTTRTFNAPTSQQKFGNDDNRSKRIERQHSQEMAIRTLSLLGPGGELIANEQDQRAIARRDIKEWTDYFCADLDAYCNSINAAPNGQAKEPANGVSEVDSEMAAQILDESKQPAGAGSPISDSDEIPFGPSLI